MPSWHTPRIAQYVGRFYSVLVVSEREEGVVASYFPLRPLKPFFFFFLSRYRDANPVSTIIMPDILATVIEAGSVSTFLTYISGAFIHQPIKFGVFNRNRKHPLAELFRSWSQIFIINFAHVKEWNQPQWRSG